MSHYASVRCRKLSSGGLVAAERHGRGDDESSKRRRVHSGPRALAYSLQRSTTGETSEEWKLLGGSDPRQGGFNLVAAHDALVTREDVVLRKSAALAMHLLVIVSPGWLDPDDAERRNPENERVRALISGAINWTQTAGLGPVFGARYDLDERGSGVVDIFAAPIREVRRGRPRKDGSQKTVREITVARALSELASAESTDSERTRRSYSALQDSWARYAAAHLDQRIQRGKPRAETGRKYLPPDDFREAVDATVKAQVGLAMAEIQADVARERIKALALLQAEMARLRANALAEVLAEQDRARDRALEEIAAARAHASDVVSNAGKYALKILAAVEEMARSLGSDALMQLAPELKSLCDLAGRIDYNSFPGVAGAVAAYEARMSDQRRDAVASSGAGEHLGLGN